MKTLFIEPLKQLTKERRLMFALAVLLIAALALILYVGVNIHQNELKIVTHYTAFGSTNFYRDKWYYLINFVVFGLAVAIIHTMITLRLLVTKGVELALSFAWASVVILFIAGAILYQVLKIAALA